MTPKLLYVTTVPYTMQAFLFPFARHFRAKGWTVDAAANGVTSAEDCVAEFDHTWDIDWARSPFAASNFLSAPKSIHDLVKREGYDIVHVTTPNASFVTRCALRQLRKRGKPKVIYSAHGFHFHPLGKPLANRAFAACERFAGRFTDYLVVTNQEDEGAALELGIVDAARLRYFHGVGVDTEEAYNPERVSADEIEQVRREFGLSDARALLVMAAEFNPGKRHRDAIEAIALASKHCDVQLALTSDGPLREETGLLVERLGLSDRVHFLGYRKDFQAMLRASRAMVLPSIREGLPRSVMDALSLEAPVIGYRIRGTSELLEGGCGILCPPGDVSALAEAMVWMVEHPEESAEMGRAGRRKMRGDYELSNILRMHEELYAEALRGS
jgi:glycosyltransferase involved in cell wall biosynthesis